MQSPLHLLAKAAAVPGGPLPAQSAFAGEVGPYSELDWAASRETSLLRAAGIAALTSAAGAVLGSASSAIPPFEGREAPPANTHAISCLGTILADNSNRRELLPEWLELAELHGVAPLPEYLPGLLDAAHSDKSLRTRVLAVADSRARWLAMVTQAPNWKWALAAVDIPAANQELVYLFETGGKEERLQALTAIRSQNAAQGLTMVMGVWDKEKWEEKAAFLDCLSTGLSTADEPLLEVTLTDRRAEVRHIGAKLLMQIPGSGMSRRFQDRTLPLFAMKKTLLIADRLDVSLPVACDEAMLRDGVLPKAPQNSGMGDRSYWLRQLIAHTRSAALCAHLRISPDKLIHLAWKTEFKDEIIAGLRESAVRFVDRQLVTELLRLALSGDQQLKAVGGIESLMLSSILTISELEELTIQTMATGALAAGVALAYEAGKCTAAWSQRFTISVLSLLSTAIRDLPPASVRAYQCRELVSLMARRAQPQYSDAFSGLLTASHASQDWQYFWQKSLDEFTAVMQFRSEMATAFADRKETVQR